MPAEVLVSGSGAARLLGISRQWVHRLAKAAEEARERGEATEATFPAPYGLLDEAEVPVWRKVDIESYREHREREQAAAHAA